MKLGFPNHPRREILAEIDWIGRNGFEFVDLCLEPDMADAARVKPAAVRQALDRYGLDVRGHMGWYLPIGSQEPRLRRAAVAIASEYLEVFAAVGVPAATIHADWPYSIFSPDEGVAYQVESLRALVEIGRRLGVGIMYEPVAGPHDTPERIEEVLAAVPELLFHLDLGHSNVWGRSVEGMIDQFGSRLYHVHLHDNNGQGDLHLPPGTGTIDWPRAVAALKRARYDRTITLETFAPDRDYALLALRKVREFFAAQA